MSAKRGMLLLAVGFAFVSWPGCIDSDLGGGRDGESREEAPALDLPLLDGGRIELGEQRGKTVILDFWATWCGPCEVQMPVLDAIWRERDSTRNDLMIVGVSVDTDPASKVAEWIAERGFVYPIAIGDQDLAMRYGVFGFPTLVIIDPSGAVRTRHTGVWSRPEIEAALDEIRSKSPKEG